MKNRHAVLVMFLVICLFPAGEILAARVAPPAVPVKDTVTMVDLGAKSCIPCKMMAPILEELKETYKGRLEIVFIDVWENPDEARKYNIKLIPTQIFYDTEDKELFRHEGFFAKEDILSKWKELGITLDAEGQ